MSFDVVSIQLDRGCTVWYRSTHFYCTVDLQTTLNLTQPLRAYFPISGNNIPFPGFWYSALCAS